MGKRETFEYELRIDLIGEAIKQARKPVSNTFFTLLSQRSLATALRKL